MAQYYTDYSTGDDTTGAGTSGNPWKTLQKAIDSATGGDMINVGNNAAEVLTTAITWTGGFGSTSTETPLVIRAWDNGGSKVVTFPDGTTATAFEIDGNDAVANIFSPTSQPQWVLLQGAILHSTTSNLFLHIQGWNMYECEFYDSSGSFLVTGSSGATKSVVRCIFRDPGAASVGGIQLITQSIFYGNYIYGMTGVGVSVVIPTCSLISNVIAGCTLSGIDCLNQDNACIVQNTIFGTSTTSTHGVYLRTSNAEGAVVFGNLISNYSGTTASGINIDSGSFPYILGRNAFYNNTTNVNDLDGRDFPLDVTAEDESESSDPFTDSSTQDFTLKATADSFASLPMNQTGSAGAMLSYGAIQQVGGGGGGGETSQTFVG